MIRQRLSQLRVINYFTKLFLFCLSFTPSVLTAQIQGKVFRDINATGVFDSTANFKEVGLSGITVTAYNAAGASVGTTTTNATGNYTIALVSGAVRVEFTGLSSIDYSGPKGTGSNTSIQFVTAPTTGVNYGVNDPDWYWNSSTNPRYVLPCYVNGISSGTGGADAGIVSTPYSSTGLNSAYQDDNNVQGTGPMPRIDATISQVGTVWGAAYYKAQKHYYFSTFLKRHCGMADGAGYIYNFDYSGATPSLTGKFNLQGVTPANGGVAIDLGSVTRTGSADYTLPTDKTQPSWDIDAFGKVATMSFGDIDMQPHTGFLWAVNLFQKALIRVDVSGNPTSTPAGVEQYILSTLPGYPTSTKGILRPWALKFERGKGYLGLVDDASISGLAADLRAIVLEFDPNNIAAGFTTKLNFDPNPKRIASGGTWLLFKSWLNTYSEANVIVDGDYRVRAQPVLSDIEFDADGNMYLSFFDRFGHQMGWYNYRPLSGSTTTVKPAVYGEIDKACKTATGWEIEGTGTCHVSSSEFFQDIAGDDERESAEGAVALLKGKIQILQVSIDPHPQGSTGSTYYNTQGINTYNLATGTIDNWYSVYYNSDTDLFGKANGLGDLELITDLAPLEVGNRIWSDTDSDGIQAADEAGIDGVTVKLFEGATEVGSTTTADGGQYYFTNTNVTGGLKYNTAYEIRIGTAQAPLSTLSLTTTDVGTNGADLIDNDGTVSGANAIKTFTTGNSGENDHSFDFGFKPASNCTEPSSITLLQNAPTCNGGTPNNDGKITLTAVTGADKFGVSTGATYSGTPNYAAAMAIGTLPQDLQTAIPNAGATYTIRFFNGADDCFKDSTVVVAGVCCLMVTATTPVCHANGTPEAPADDYFTFSINAVSSLAGSETFTVTAVQNGNPLAVTLSNGSPATAVNCALDAPLRTPDGSAGNGDVTLTITDNNFGCTTTLVVTDPGECGLTCTPGSPQMVMYNYSTQFDITELENLPIVIPKFDDQGGTRALVSAKLDYEIGVKSVMLHENRAANPQNFRANSLTDAFIDLNGSTIATASLSIPGVQTNVPAGILVPAQGAWPGDSTPPIPQLQVASTLLAMDPWLTNEKLTFFKDPRTDPRWVTNATGDPAHDDDIIYYPPAIDTALGSITYTAPGDLALFIGTGSLPLTASTLSGLQTFGGGGNILTFQRTRAYAAAKVTYTFECAVSCTQPTAITLTQTAPTCAAGVAQNDGKITLAAVTGADKFGVSTGATYSGTPNYAAATAIGTLPQDLFSAVPNTGGTFTIRLFNGADNCFKDTTLTVLAVNCGCLSLDPWMTAQALGGTGGPTSSVASGVGTLGGERDMVLSNLTPADANGIFATSEPAYFAGYPVLEIANASGRFSKLTITYDGPDGNAATIDTTGLNGVDLLTNGANGFVSTINTDGAPGTGDLPVMFQVFDMNGGASSALINVAPTNNATIAFNAPFSAFAAIGGFSAADFTQVGSIVLMIDMQTRNGWDVLMTDMKLDCCISPSAITMTQTAPTCTSGTPNNDGKITLTAVTGADKFGISTGATYSGTPNYAAATAIGTLPQDLQTAIPNAGGTYTIRFFNGSDDCFKDSTVVVNAVSCTPPCAITNVTATPTACNPMNNKYDVSGQITFTNPPADGILTVRIPSKGSIVFNAPFVSPLSYLLSGLNSDGLADTVLVSFNKSICTGSAIYTSPAMCLPDVCVLPETGGVETFNYSIPTSTTNWTMPLVLPKFDDMGGTRILKNVLLTANQSIQNWGIIESMDNEPTLVNILTNGFTLIKLGTDTIASNSFMIENIPDSVAAGIPVPAQGGWSGDNVTGSTIFSMPFLASALASKTDPTLDPNWVTTLTGNPVHDDDISYFPPFSTEKSSCWQFNTPTELMQFIGTGNLDMTAVAKGAGFADGSGNISTMIRTAASADVSITYLFCNAVAVCAQPSAISLSQTAATCTSGTPNNDGKITLTAITGADKFGISTGATYSGTPNYAAATAIGTLPQDLQTAIPNAGGTYTIRFFNGADDCFKDSTVTVAAVGCVCTTFDVPELTVAGISFAPGSAPVSENVTLNGGGNVLPENNIAGFYFSTSSEGPFYTLCTQIAQPVLPLQNPYTHELTNTANGFTPAVALRLAQLVEASGFNSTTGFGAGNNTITNFVAMQFAVWNSLYDTDYSLVAGPFQVLTENNPGARTLGDSWLAAAQSIATPSAVVHNLAHQTGQDLLMLGDVPPVTVSVAPPTCTGANSPNNGKMTVIGFTAGQRYQYTSGTTFAGTPIPAAITNIPAGGVIDSTLSNLTSAYTVRVYDINDDNCFTDRTVYLTAVVCCELPTAITLSQTAATCVSGVAQNDGKITLTAVTGADKFGVSTGATYSGTPDYMAATAIGTLPQDLQTAIPNAGETYTIRFFNGADDCFKDSTVTVAAVNCVAPCALTITSVTPSVCNPATNQFSLDVVVTYLNPPTGGLTVSTSGGATSTVAQTGSPQTISFTGLNSDGVQDYAVVAEFVNDSNCKHVLPAAYDAPASCLCDTTLVVRDSTICAGAQVNLFAQTSGVKGVLTYSTDGLVFNPLTDPTLVSPTATATFYVKDSLSAACLDIETLEITVVQPANAGIANNPLAPICMAATGLATIDLFAQISGEDAGGTWAKTSGPAVGINFDANAGTLDPNGLTAGTYVFEYTVTGDAPCPNDSETVSVTIQDCTLPCPPKVCLPITVVKVIGGN